GLCNLAPQPLTCLLPGVGPRHALGTVLVAGQLLELAQLGDGTAGVEGHAATLTSAGPSVVSIVRCRRSRTKRRARGDSPFVGESDVCCCSCSSAPPCGASGRATGRSGCGSIGPGRSS